MLEIRWWFLIVVGAGIFLDQAANPVMGIASGGEKKADATPDQQVKELFDKYRALDDKARLGPQGTKIFEQLKAVRGLSPKSQDALAQLVAAHNRWVLGHNLGQLGQATHEFKSLPPSSSYSPFSPFPAQILPYVEQQPGLTTGTPPRHKWEYKVANDADIRTLGKGDLTAGLNKLGAENWELVSIRETQFFFKRIHAVQPVQLPVYLCPADPSQLSLDLLSPKSLTKLNLTKEQMEKYATLNQEFQDSRKKLPPADGLSQIWGYSPIVAKLGNLGLDKLAANLSETQKTTLQEIRKEQWWLSASPFLGYSDSALQGAKTYTDTLDLITPKGLAKLNLTKEQKEKYATLNQEFQDRRKKLPMPMQSWDGGNRLFGDQAVAVLGNESLDKLAAVLTKTQKSTLQEIRAEQTWLRLYFNFLNPLNPDAGVPPDF